MAKGSGKGTVKGEARMRRTLNALARDLSGPGLVDVNTANGRALLSRVRARTPRRSGRLAASMRVVPAGALTAAVQSGSAYSAPVEGGVGPRRGLRGGHNIRAARMMAKGAEDATPAAVANVARGVQRSVRQVKGA